MPDRILRKEVITSDRVNACGAVAQLFFYKLISIVDDYGCFDGRQGVIASQAYPLGGVQALPIAELVRNELVVTYTNAGKPYIALMQWGEVRRGARKFPAPPVCNELRGVTYQGYFGREMSWHNPDGSDPVSILLDEHGAQVVPQPGEWRAIHGDYAPAWLAAQIAEAEARKQRNKRPAQALASKPHEPQSLAPKPTVLALGAKPSLPVTGVQSLGTVHRTSSIDSSTSETPKQEPSIVSLGAQGVEPATASTAASDEEPIKFDGRAFAGVSEAQELRWQDMFASISVPDQIARAAAWLAVQTAEQREASLGGGHGAFLVRWLLRESRNSTSDNRKAADA